MSEEPVNADPAIDPDLLIVPLFKRADCEGKHEKPTRAADMPFLVGGPFGEEHRYCLWCALERKGRGR